MPPSEPSAARRPRPKPKERAAWGTISRNDIVDAALRSGRGSGFEQMTIRSLATELGVAPMSLYRHIRDKDDLLDEVVEELLRRSWRPPSGDDWQTRIARAADALRRLLVREPAALYVYQRRPVVSPTAIKRMESMLEVLRNAGLDEEAAHRSYAAVHTYTIGFAALEASRAASAPSPDLPGDLAADLTAYTTPQQFAVGLDYLLKGIERLHPTTRRPAPPSG